MRIRSFVASVARSGTAARPDRDTPRGEDPRSWRAWHDGALTVWFAPREATSLATGPITALPDLILGDDSEWSAVDPDAALAGGVPVRYDPTTRTLVMSSSIVALPPLFVYRGPQATAVASDLALLSSVSGVRLELDAQGVTELGWFGHPVEQRTLFRHVELVPGGGRLALTADGRADFQRTWRLPPGAPRPWNEFIEAQIAAFTAAMNRTEVSRSFLSLTAGLDTRTVFASLAAQNRLVTGVTMTGPRRSLDARTAGKLCGAYGVEHRAVVLDGAFVRDLPRLVERANTLSGGLSSLGQAPEVFLYEQVGGGYGARLSGNLGNQVGRGGTEGVSIRGAALEILAADLRAALSSEHWLLARLGQEPRAATEFILQSEIAFSSVGNYSVGNHFAAQQSPYASRALIETIASRPLTASDVASGSKLHMRLRDLRHRFLGEPEESSFQRALVKRLGGAAARIPVNWGWRTTGGVSPVGLALGAATFVGMAARATGLDDGAIGRLVTWTGLPALHDFRESRRWLRHDLREFTLDVLRTRAVVDQLFDAQRLDAVLHAYFEGHGDHYETVTFALDVALAHRMVAR